MVVVSGVTPSDKGWVALAGAVEVPSAAVIFRRRVKRSQKGDGEERTFEGEGETDEESSGVGSEGVVGRVGGVEAAK